MSNSLLEGKNAVIFGAGGSIGAAVAKEFAAEGAEVFLSGRNEASVAAVAGQIAAAGGRAHVATLDTHDEAAVERYLEGVVRQAAARESSVVDETRRDRAGAQRSGAPRNAPRNSPGRVPAGKQRSSGARSPAGEAWVPEAELRDSEAEGAYTEVRDRGRAAEPGVPTAQRRAVGWENEARRSLSLRPQQAGKLDVAIDVSGPLAQEYSPGTLALDLPVERFMVPLTSMLRSRFITARAAARHMTARRSGVILFVTGSPARPHVPGATSIGSAFAAMENLTQNLAFEISPLGVRVVCIRVTANTDSRTIRDGFGEQAVAQIAQLNFLKIPASVQDTANAAVFCASDRARMVTGTVFNISAGAALD